MAIESIDGIIKAFGVIVVCKTLDLLHFLHPPVVLHVPEGTLGLCSFYSGLQDGRSLAGQASFMCLMFGLNE